jgi:ABC-type multidrug transport system fused ATPase/permease subunit
VRGCLRWVAPGSALLIVYNAALMLQPVVIGRLVDEVIAPASAGTSLGALAGTLALWTAALAGLYLAMNLGYRFGGRMGWFGVQRSHHELSRAVLGRLLDERGSAGPAKPPGALLSIATADVHRACQVLYATIYPPGEILGLLLALGIGTVLALPLVLLLMHLAARPLRRRSLAEQEGMADAAAAAADLVGGYRVIRGLHAQGTASDRYRAVSRETLRATLAARSAHAAFTGLSTAAAQLFAVVVAVAAALMAFAGTITPGQLVTVAGIAVNLVRPLDALVGTLGSLWAISQASARRLLDLLATAPHPAALGDREGVGAPEGAGASGSPRGGLLFEDLRLPGGTRLSGGAGPGELVVLDLPREARTALHEVLTLRAVPAHGAVRAGGERLHRWRPSTLRRHLLVAPTAPGLFAGSVLENVAATGEDPVPAERARDALEIAALAGNELPGGADTPVGDGGWELSGGQRQRLGLARAVAADPAVLVLVDPTTSVDAVTEARIARALRAGRAGRTTLVVSSSPVFRGVADRVLTADPEED